MRLGAAIRAARSGGPVSPGLADAGPVAAGFLAPRRWPTGRGPPVGLKSRYLQHQTSPPGLVLPLGARALGFPPRVQSDWAFAPMLIVRSAPGIRPRPSTVPAAGPGRAGGRLPAGLPAGEIPGPRPDRPAEVPSPPPRAPVQALRERIRPNPYPVDQAPFCLSHRPPYTKPQPRTTSHPFHFFISISHELRESHSGLTRLSWGPPASADGGPAPAGAPGTGSAWPAECCWAFHPWPGVPRPLTVAAGSSPAPYADRPG